MRTAVGNLGITRDRDGKITTIDYRPQDDPYEVLREAYVRGHIELHELEEILTWKLWKDDRRGVL